MRNIRLIAAALALAAPLAAQFAKFECQPVGSSFPMIAGTADCEGIVADYSAGGAAVVATWTPSWGFPTEGARFAHLLALLDVDRAYGVIVTRPLPVGTTEIRIPIPAGSVYVAFDWGWVNEEGPWSPNYNDGFDFSVCDESGVRLAQCAWGDTSIYGGGPTGPQSFALKIEATPPGAYLSCAVMNSGDTCCAGNRLFVDNVRFVHDLVTFECDTPGAVPPLGTCEDVTVRTAGTGAGIIGAASTCGFPMEGGRFLELVPYGMINIPRGGVIARPAPADVTEALIRIPIGTTVVSFAYGFKNCEGDDDPNDGFDVSICDAAGQLLYRCVYGDTGIYPDFGCNGPFRFRGEFPALPSGAVLSGVMFNGGDFAVPSRLYLDDVSFVSKPRLTYSSPLGPGSLQMKIEYGIPGALYFVPMTLVQGACPEGWFYGLDITFGDLITEATVGPPFLGLFDAGGRTVFGPIGVSIPGIVLYGVPIDDLWAPVPRFGDPIRYAIP